MVIVIFVAGILFTTFSGMMGDLTDSSSNQLFSLRIENIAMNSTCMIIHIGNQLDADVAVTRVYVNNEPRDLLRHRRRRKNPKSFSRLGHVKGAYAAGGMYDVKIVFDSDKVS